MLKLINQFYKNYQLINAVSKDHLDEAKRLLEQGANPNVYTSDAPLLLVPVVFKHFEMVKLLLEKGADPNLGESNQDTPCTHAAAWLRYEMVKIMLRFGGELNPHKDELQVFIKPEMIEFVKTEKEKIQMRQYIFDLKQVAFLFFQGKGQTGSSLNILPRDILIPILLLAARDEAAITLTSRQKKELAFLFFKRPPKNDAEFKEEEKDLAKVLTNTQQK